MPLTRTLERNNLNENIPEKTKKEIEERGFSLYKWISPQEVKTSIQRDYLSILSTFWIWIGWGAILLSLFWWGFTPLSFGIFFWILGIFYTLVLIYLIAVAIKRSIILTNSANVILTEKAISIWGEILDYEKLNSNNKTIQKISSEFEEPLFAESNLEKKKWQLLENTMNSIGEAWGWVFKMLWDFDRGGRDSGQLVIFVVLLWILYTATMGIIYFSGLFFIWIFSLGITLFNKFLLRISGHQVQRINDTFENIDMLSNTLVDESTSLGNFLDEARKNNWQDGLLLKINKGIENINSSASESVDDSKHLRNLLEDSEYKDIFNFWTYGNWVKSKIIAPLEKIYELLEKNTTILQKTIQELENQITETKEASLSWPLELQKKRLQSQKQQFEKQKELISSYLEKLKTK